MNLQPIEAASTKSMLPGRATRFMSANGTATRRPNPPEYENPGSSGVRQTFDCPLRQYSQVPSPWLNGTTTRSPFLKLRISLPTSSTTPQNSWPRIAPGCAFSPIQLQSPDHACQSERQTPFASTRTMALLGAHSGSGTFFTTSGFLVASNTAALICQSSLTPNPTAAMRLNLLSPMIRGTLPPPP